MSSFLLAMFKEKGLDLKIFSLWIRFGTSLLWSFLCKDWNMKLCLESSIYCSRNILRGKWDGRRRLFVRENALTEVVSMFEARSSNWLSLKNFPFGCSFFSRRKLLRDFFPECSFWD